MQGMARDIIAFIHALGAEQVDIFGFSIGGMIAQQVALDAPELVRRLIPLLNIAKTLLALYRTPGDAEWSQICELIAETLPGVIAKVEVADGRLAPR
jgi:pimeloyl-ACP methyl ester carboxylesterase